MADEQDIRRAAAALPETTVSVEEPGRLVVAFRDKALAWTWMERTEPKGPRLPNPAVLGIRVDGALGKEELLASDTRKFFTEPHYNGFPAVLVRLAEVDADELAELLTEAWRIRAPKRLAREHGL